MKKFKIISIEQEQFRREYVIEAEDENEAFDKIQNREVEPNKEECFNWENNIDGVTELI